MAEWNSHAQATRDVLESILQRAVSEKTPGFSYSERALFTACEFWAAAMNRMLLQHLGRSAAVQLLVAKNAFTTIGAIEVAEILRRGRAELTQLPATTTLASVAPAIERALAMIRDPVDALIALFAAQLRP